ncbi:MAG TPA: hypothetical protein VKD22_17810, partial [Ramlibacter sp.]|nr:hypothetical protein [Ramlibacter sp.]
MRPRRGAKNYTAALRKNVAVSEAVTHRSSSDAKQFRRDSGPGADAAPELHLHQCNDGNLSSGRGGPAPPLRALAIGMMHG